MEIFRGKAHLPGADKEWNIELEIDWVNKEVNVHIDEASDAMTDWPGLVVQTFSMEEIVFRTKGIPNAGILLNPPSTSELHSLVSRSKNISFSSLIITQSTS